MQNGRSSEEIKPSQRYYGESRLQHAVFKIRSQVRNKPFKKEAPRIWPNMIKKWSSKRTLRTYVLMNKTWGSRAYTCRSVFYKSNKCNMFVFCDQMQALLIVSKCARWSFVSIKRTTFWPITKSTWYFCYKSNLSVQYS